jgi:hypothetical protein
VRGKPGGANIRPLPRVVVDFEPDLYDGEAVVEAVLPDGRRGVVEIDDSLWFEGLGPWSEPQTP